MNYKTSNSMVSGQYEARVRKYHKYTGKSGKTWLVADQPAAAENIYVSDPNPPSNKNWAGFGGATLKFPLVEGGEEVLTGPWHTNAEALFKDTGIDVRDEYYTFCVIAKDQTGWSIELVDVLYIDQSPVLGYFDRPEIEKKAQELADSLGHSVFFYKETSGGSCCRPINPTVTGKWTPRE